ncbi:MAG TPA: histidine--tRNA ligase, partial [Firmicutes bacterium]|nr:histidine--tRNA ligase [Bacillota bacterium]
MKIQNVKGGYDFLPKEQKIRNYINGVLKSTFEEYGYLPIETPILCYFDMLAGKYDENNDILNEIYKLKDQGNRNLGLRYDLTVPFAKFIALNKNELKLPFKRYEINKVFRDGPVKVGRDREFTQCDVDVVGLSNQMIEAELLSLYVRAFTKLGIEIKIKYNSRNLMRGLIKNCGVEEQLISPTITIVDKIDKLSEEDFLKELTNIGLSYNQALKLLDSFNMSLEKLNEIFKNSEIGEIQKGLEELNNLEDYINAINIKEYCEFTSSLARGQDYYTGNVFEVYEANGKLPGAIGGGGRYDKMITEFIDDGEIYPAVGISFGLTSIFELLKNNEELSSNNAIDLYIIPLGTEKYSLSLANKIRELGYKVDIEMNNKKIKKSLDYCNKENIPFVIILGEDEINNK